jgi:serine/threonine-protein kinase
VPPAKELPDLEGMTVAAARGEVGELGARLRVSMARSQRSEGTVLSQEPSPGTKVERGDVVAVVVARGESAPERTAVDVPSVVGLAVTDAVARVRGAGLIHRIRLVASTDRAGRVVRQSPTAGTAMTVGRTIRLDVSRARPVPSTIQVPSVVGMTAVDARGRLRQLGLAVQVTELASDEAVGTVLRQSPRAGVELQERGLVTLTVSSGPQRMDVPDVAGLDEDSARQQLVAAGFQVEVTDEPTADAAQDGLVLRQSPSGGSAAAEGAVVSIVVARLG